MNRKILIFTTIFILLNALICFSEINLPEPPKDTFVYDEMDILSEDTKKYILDINKKLENTGSQIAVAVVKDLQDSDIETYANELFRKWGIGDKEKNNGALLLAAIDDRKVRIEVGYGLEGAITDSNAGDIIRNAIVPNFKNEEYDKGILEAFLSISHFIETEYNISILSDEDKYKTISYNKKRKSKSIFSKINDFIYAIKAIIKNPTKPSSLFIICFIILTIIGSIFSINSSETGKTSRKSRKKGRNKNSGGGSSGGGFGGGSSGGGGASGDW